MCGIAGILHPGISKESPFAPIRKMTDIIVHRGPDGSGYFQEDGVAFGHRRLSIIDLSDLGHQPMDYMGRYVITYNGEVYNYIELRKELETVGYTFISRTDTEVMLAAYDYWKEDCLNHFNGMFSFAIYDRQEKVVFCARDRFGVKPFYYWHRDNLFAFGSEIKQFTTLPGWKAVVNPQRAADFLTLGIQGHSPETFFEGVLQLPGGHSLTYNLIVGSFSIRKWYDLSKSASRSVGMSLQDASAGFGDLLADSVRLRLRSDVKIGSCLSGGLDSSSIVCLVNEQLRKVGANDRQETVTSCFEDKKFDEREFAEEVVRATGAVSHKVYPSFQRLFPELDEMVWHQDEPFLSTSIYAQWNVFRTARENGITVMLDGQGADEILGGYPTFFAPRLLSLLKRGNVRDFLSEVRGIQNNTPYRLPWIGKELVKNAIGRKNSDALLGAFTSRGSILSGNGHAADDTPKLTYSDFKEMSLSQITSTNLPMLLQYEDRNSMAFSIESRVPFLDYRLVEFVYGLPVELLLHEGWSKYILRKAMKGKVPDKVLDRKDKMGFVTAEEKWLRESPQEFEARLKEAVDASGGFISPACLKTFEQMRDGRIPFSFVIWRIVSFGAWLKKFDVHA